MSPATPPSHPRKRCLLWDWTNTRDRPSAIDQLFPPGQDASATPFISCHNWNAWAPPELKGRLAYQPMIRTPAQADGNDWAMIVGAASDASKQPVTVHFYNEPERISPPVTPEAAAKTWLEKVVPELRTKHGARLVGPACASDSAGEAWLAQFLRLVRDKGQPPDYLGLHYYGPDASAAQRYFEEMHAKYAAGEKDGPALPVIISEVGCISRDAAEVRRFTRRLTSWMDATDWVAEYGWFGCMAHVADDFVSPAAQLMDKDGAFTPLMRVLMQPDVGGED